MQIISMRDLKNTVEVEKRCAKGEPVYVTKNGYGSRLVVIDIDFHENTIREIYEAKAILEGLKDAEEGRTIDGDQAISTLRSAYEL